MRVTLHPSKPLIWWYNRRGSIDMTPPYQRRGRLWSPSDKRYLIDSIINGFDVPKLYIADFQFGANKLNAIKLPYAIIDGKQRLEAIFDFFDGKLVLNEDFILKSNPNLKLGGLGLRDLIGSYPSIAELFETETIDVMSVVTDNEDEINELFIRLNRSKPLTGAEIRNALVGPVPDVIRSVARHPFFSENIKFSVARAGDYNAAAKLVLFEYSGKPVSTKKKDLDYFAKGRDVNREHLELSGRRALDILDTMQEVFLPSDDLLSSAGPIPVYYWLIRKADKDYIPYMRMYIKGFESARKVAREKQLKESENLPNRIFARYDTLNRSINDVGSHVGRVEILLELMPGWMEKWRDGLGRKVPATITEQDN